VIAEARYNHRVNEIFDTYGIIGQSIHVGIVSDTNIAYINDLVQNGELPSEVTIVSDSPGSATDSSIGTAMLELVHDVCPGCKHFFASGNGMEETA